MAKGKSIGQQGNERIRELVRAVVAAHQGKEVAAAKALGVSQSYISEFLASKRGAGTKLLRGLARLKPESASMLLGARDDAPPVATEPAGEAVRVASSILRKRGWSDEEISWGRKRARTIEEADANDPVALADAWELPLLGVRGAQPTPAPRKSPSALPSPRAIPRALQAPRPHGDK